MQGLREDGVRGGLVLCVKIPLKNSFSKHWWDDQIRRRGGDERSPGVESLAAPCDGSTCAGPYISLMEVTDKQQSPHGGLADSSFTS